mmetsp:Transcript_45491/g.125620  ORF Transcript_45491/g.125620 Transcript_45491/m.125620 type:complete len:276 (+) Transcript_45491:1115-1942(+)
MIKDDQHLHAHFRLLAPFAPEEPWPRALHHLVHRRVALGRIVLRREQIAPEIVRIHDVRPVLKRRRPEKRQHGQREVRKVEWVGFGEHHEAHEPIHVEHEQHEQTDVPDRFEPANESHHDHLQLGDPSKKLAHAGKAHQSQHLERRAAGNLCGVEIQPDSADDEVECIPLPLYAQKVAPWGETFANRFDDDLAQENEGHQVVQRVGCGIFGHVGVPHHYTHHHTRCDDAKKNKVGKPFRLREVDTEYVTKLQIGADRRVMFVQAIVIGPIFFLTV